MKQRSRLPLFAIGLGVISAAALTLACGGSSGPSAPSAVTPRSVTVTLVGVGTAYQATAVAAFSDGSSREVTAEAVWASSNPAVATVSEGGQVTPVAPGSTEVRATYQAVIGGAALSVAAPPPLPPPAPKYTVTVNIRDALDSQALGSGQCCNVRLTPAVWAAEGLRLSGSSSSNGKYTVHDVPAGEAEIVVAPYRGWASETRRIVIAGDVTLDFDLRPLPVRVYGDLSDPRTEARPPACQGLIEVIDGPDAGRWTRPPTFTRFEFPERLQPGLVTFRYSAPGGYETRTITTRLRGVFDDGAIQIGAGLSCPGCPSWSTIYDSCH